MATWPSIVRHRSVSSAQNSIINGNKIAQASSDIDGLPDNKWPPMAVDQYSTFDDATVLDGTNKWSVNTDRVTDLAIEYGSIEPGDKIGSGATCTVTKASLVGVGETRLRAMLPNESEPASIKGDSNYIAQHGYDEKVWVNQTGGSVRIVTTVDGWQGTLNVNADQINNVGGASSALRRICDSASNRQNSRSSAMLCRIRRYGLAAPFRRRHRPAGRRAVGAEQVDCQPVRRDVDGWSRCAGTSRRWSRWERDQSQRAWMAVTSCVPASVRV